MLIQQQAKLPWLSAALPGEACLEKPFFSVSKVCLKPLLSPGQTLHSSTPAVKVCAPAPRIPPGAVCREKGSGFSHSTDNDLLCNIKRALKEHIKALNTDELHTLKILKVWNTECTIDLTHSNFLSLALKTTPHL